jgi:tryptophanyl-tRNA synthetase
MTPGTKKVSLTGIKPSGTPHIGNYLGMVQPALELAKDHTAYYFIADEHALTTIRDADEMRQLSYEAAAMWLALGLDPSRVVVYRQSDVPAVFELNWILSCVTPKGLLNRAHAYKAVVDENEAAGRTTDDGVSMGLYNYPVLMAADILIVDADVVPVGDDQKQHVEIARDIAEAFNRSYGDVLRLPEPYLTPIIPGPDGRKMSKSYNNVIPIFEEPARQRKYVMRIVTDSRSPEEPKDPDTDGLFKTFQYFGEPDDISSVRERYVKGGIGYGEVKTMLADSIERRFAEPLSRYNELMADRAQIDEILADGAARVRPIAEDVLARVRRAVGLAG